MEREEGTRRILEDSSVLWIYYVFLLSLIYLVDYFNDDIWLVHMINIL